MADHLGQWVALAVLAVVLFVMVIRMTRPSRRSGPSGRGGIDFDGWTGSEGLDTTGHHHGGPTDTSI